MSNRREFVQQFATGVAAFTIPVSLPGEFASFANTPTAGPKPEDWDLSWVRRLTGRHRAVFDTPAIESGYGVWRASLWAQQYKDVLGVAPSDMSSVIVLRHAAIVLALKQEYWDQYAVGQSANVTDPVTQQATQRNPVLLQSSTDGTPAMFDPLALPQYIARGGIVLACNVALGFDIVPKIAAREHLAEDAAHEKAVSYLLPGVILQPSGVFAAIKAQEEGCQYLRAS